jgi:hypothetical protein
MGNNSCKLFGTRENKWEAGVLLLLIRSSKDKQIGVNYFRQIAILSPKSKPGNTWNGSSTH